VSEQAPLRLNGAKFRADKTGLISYVEPWEVYTLEQCATFTPSDRPLGLPITDRNAEEFEVGTWTLTLTYEGQAGDGDVSFDSADSLEIELDTTMSQDPIKSHPNFEALKGKYGWDTGKEEFAETLPATGGQSSALSGSKKAQRNPLHGVDSFLSVGALFRVTYAAKRPQLARIQGPSAAGQAPPEVSLPVGFTTFPGEIFQAPRSWVEASYPNPTYFNKADRGGHFAAWEQPEAFVRELRKAFALMI